MAEYVVFVSLAAVGSAMPHFPHPSSALQSQHSFIANHLTFMHTYLLILSKIYTLSHRIHGVWGIFVCSQCLHIKKKKQINQLICVCVNGFQDLITIFIWHFSMIYLVIQCSFFIAKNREPTLSVDFVVAVVGC